MKRQNLSFAKSKSTLLLLLVAAGISFTTSSCSKNDDDATPGVTNEQAATVVQQSITSQGGVIEQIDLATSATAVLSARQAGGKLSDFCGLSKDGSASGNGNANGFSFAYSLKWLYSLNCTENVPQKLNFNFSGKTAFGTEQFATVDSSTSTNALSGLAETSTNWEINQTYDRTGTLLSKTKDLPSFSSTVHYEAVGIKVNKQTRAIVSGTATVKISGKDLKGNSFSYEGTLTFKGDRKATYVVSGGGTFELTW